MYSKVSLILCTIDRTLEVETFLKYALNYSYQNFEIIICDQNKDDRILHIVSNPSFKDLNIQVIKTQRGLSRSRNQGLLKATGEIISIPDDDCFFEKDTLEKVVHFFYQNPSFDILIAKWENPEKQGYQPHKDKVSHEVKDPLEVFSFMSSEIFIRKQTLDEIGGFDEKLGLGSGSIYWGGEDYDLLLHTMKIKKRIFYSSDIIIYHPWKGVETLKSKETWEKHYTRIKHAGASDFYLFKKYFTYTQRIKLIINNVLVGLLNFILFRTHQFKNHYYRIMGFLMAYRDIKENKR